MKSCYVIEHAQSRRISIADLTVVPSSSVPTMLVTRINVPLPLRGAGFGNKLLREITSDADIAGVRLIVEAVPSGEMDFPALVGWYKRNGFQNLPGYPEHILERLPLQSNLNMPASKEVNCQ